jgi:hypothetical protein
MEAAGGERVWRATGEGSYLGVVRRVEGERPAAEVGEGGGRGGGEDVGAGGGGVARQPRRWSGIGRNRGPARGGIVDAAAAPLERECEEGEREREGRQEQKQVAPRRAAAARQSLRRRRHSFRVRSIDWVWVRSFPAGPAAPSMCCDFLFLNFAKLK